MSLQKNNRSEQLDDSATHNRVRPIRRSVSWAVACVFLVVVAGWMVSGLLTKEEVILQETTRAEEASAPIKVQVQQPVYEQVGQRINITGNTAPKRSVKVPAATSGTVVRLQVEKGQMVKAGQALLQLDAADRNSRLVEAKAGELQEKIHYNSTRNLVNKGLASKLELTQAKARLESARARVDAASQALGDTRITAPFSGLITSQKIELGSYAFAGSELLEIAEITPTLVAATLTERDLAAIGNQVSQANIELATGEKLKGTLSYIAPRSNSATNTFPIEIEIAGDVLVKLGVTAKVELILAPVSGLRITPDQLELNSQGDLTIKYVDNKDQVQEARAQMIRSTASNVWVKVRALPNDARVIVSGGGFVQTGDKVDPVMRLVSEQKK